jgi:uncharacterized protein YfaT (DUF1175 family)
MVYVETHGYASLFFKKSNTDSPMQLKINLTLKALLITNTIMTNSIYKTTLRIITIYLTFTILHCRADTLTSSLTSFPADAISGGAVALNRTFGSEDKIIIPKSDSIEIISVEETSSQIKVYFKSTKKPGKVVFQSEKGLQLELDFYSSVSDSDEDGFPDSVELSREETERFRNWFVRIAESQFVKPNSYWNPNERDCAGLIRYSYREALKKHDADWFLQSGISLDKNLPDIVSYSYPNIPFLEEKIFKQKKGSALDLTSFGTFADAETLFRFNTIFISKNIVEAKKGDLLFFENRGEIRFPFHSMIVSDVAGIEPIVIYHTGDGNILKRVPISYLASSKIFRVSPENPHFLGVYRFSILE